VPIVKSKKPNLPVNRQQAFSLLEIVLVIGLIGFVYSVAIPQLNLKSGAESANKMAQFAGDIRNAFDLAVLSGKSYRMVVNFVSGDYWLEEADRRQILLGDAKLDRDLTEQEEEEEQQIFDQDFLEYEDILGEGVYDQEADKEIPPTSPVVEAKSALRPPRWSRVATMEWQGRTLGPHLMFQDLQGEHHGRKQDFSEYGEEARGFIYFFANGYVEKAVFHIAFRLDGMTLDEEQEPYTVITNPWDGTATVKSGYIEVDVHSDEKA
jgi:type II secretory pathway pseudopilin PulG